MSFRVAAKLAVKDGNDAVASGATDYAEEMERELAASISRSGPLSLDLRT